MLMLRKAQFMRMSGMKMKTKTLDLVRAHLLITLVGGVYLKWRRLSWTMEPTFMQKMKIKGRLFIMHAVEATWRRPWLLWIGAPTLTLET